MIVERSALDALLGSIAGQGYEVLGPTVHDGAIVYREVRSAADLPIGWGDEQDGGTYRLRRREDEAVFGYAVGPQSWKQFRTLPGCGCGELGAGRTVMALRSPRSPPMHLGTRSSACVRASCTQSRFRIRCFCQVPIPI